MSKEMIYGYLHYSFFKCVAKRFDMNRNSKLLILLDSFIMRWVPEWFIAYAHAKRILDIIYIFMSEVANASCLDSCTHDSKTLLTIRQL